MYAYILIIYLLFVYTLFTEAGTGMEWDKPIIYIDINDIIYWKWKSPGQNKNAKFTILQTKSLYDEYDGTGFGKTIQTGVGK